MIKKKVLKCKINPNTGEYRCKSGKKFKTEGKCTISQKGKQGGISILGSGGNYGSSDSDIKCHDNNDFRRKIEDKYKDFEVVLED